jgi:hypothetical protein
MPRAGAATIAVLAALAGALPAAAVAAPPPNDAPSSPGAFSPYTAANGTPHELQAIAELAGATPDPGVPRCLGPGSFQRTVWYLIPASDSAQEMTVEASGRTLSVIDLAAFVQPANPTGPLTALPNACSGLGSGGSDAAEEPNDGVSLWVPAGRAVLLQVGRRGPVGSADDERAVLSLDERPVVTPDPTLLDTDIADPFTPHAHGTGTTLVPLGAATITEEDPAEPPCPSLGTVWRRLEPGRPGPRVISASGNSVGTLTVFAGQTPTAANALDCIDRARGGSLQMLVQTKVHQTLWIRIGVDRPAPGSEATIDVEPDAGALVIDGGPGGFDPTPGGPGGGFPSRCFKTALAKVRIAGPGFGGLAKAANRRPSVALPLTVRGGPICDVQLQLYGPGGHIYAGAQAISLRGRRVVRLPRSRNLVKGGYRLRVSAESELGKPAFVTTDVRGSLR